MAEINYNTKTDNKTGKSQVTKIVKDGNIEIKQFWELNKDNKWILVKTETIDK